MGEWSCRLIEFDPHKASRIDPADARLGDMLRCVSHIVGPGYIHYGLDRLASVMMTSGHWDEDAEPQLPPLAREAARAFSIAGLLVLYLAVAAAVAWAGREIVVPLAAWCAAEAGIIVPTVTAQVSRHRAPLEAAMIILAAFGLSEAAARYRAQRPPGRPPTATTAAGLTPP